MRYWELTESKWWDKEPTVRLYHGTSSELVHHIREHGLQPPKDDLLEYALDVLESYIPREDWTDELIRNVQEHAARTEMGRKGDRGSVLYFFSDPEAVEGYARSYAKHGGEIAYDVYNSACMFLSDPDISWKEFKANPPLQPRWVTGKPIVVEVEVPKSWCLSDIDFEEFKARMMTAWDEGKTFARKFPSPEAFLDNAFENREIRIARTIPPEMIISVREVEVTPLNEKVEMIGWGHRDIPDVRAWRNPRLPELMGALEISRQKCLRGLIEYRSGDMLVWDAYDASHEDIAALTGLDPYDDLSYEPFIMARSEGEIASESDWLDGLIYRTERGGFYLLGDAELSGCSRVEALFGQLFPVSEINRTPA
jgi:hypothetical protein